MPGMKLICGLSMLLELGAATSVLFQSGLQAEERDPVTKSADRTQIGNGGGKVSSSRPAALNTPIATSAGFSFPGFPTLASIAQQVRFLQGNHEFVFSMYGAPSESEPLRQLVRVMQAEHLGNGFDPGPGLSPGAQAVFDYLATVGWPVICYSGAEMQIQGGRAILGREHLATLAAMDRAAGSPPSNWVNGVTTFTTWHRSHPGGGPFTARNSTRSNT